MTNRNQLWTRANALNETRCVQLLKKLFPSMSYIFTSTSSGIVRTEVATKRDALRILRQTLNKITETEAAYYISILDAKPKPTQIKY